MGQAVCKATALSIFQIDIFARNSGNQLHTNKTNQFVALTVGFAQWAYFSGKGCLGCQTTNRWMINSPFVLANSSFDGKKMFSTEVMRTYFCH